MEDGHGVQLSCSKPFPGPEPETNWALFTGAYAAQAQAQAQQSISNTESLELVRHVCVLWHAGMSIKVLNPKDDESRRLMEWIEGGVYDAVRRGYLKTLLFGIASNVKGTELLEEYAYHFSYGEDGLLSMLNMQHQSHDGNKITVVPQKYMQMYPTNTAPAGFMDHRYLFCRLVYHDHCPEEYEPEFFRCAVHGCRNTLSCNGAATKRIKMHNPCPAHTSC
eukprot:355066-Chlamydomonas_euryale.AAC.13